VKLAQFNWIKINCSIIF